jgi:hypothetical protein
MAKRLQITLPRGWVDYSHENPDGPPTYLRDLSSDPGPLQVSWAEYKSGPVPNPSATDLEQMSREHGQESFGAAIESSSGTCDFGHMGTAIFRSAEHSRVQFWHISNGRDIIMVTHICPEEPDPDEVREVQDIVRALTLSEGKPKWKFW